MEILKLNISYGIDHGDKSICDYLANTLVTKPKGY